MGYKVFTVKSLIFVMILLLLFQVIAVVASQFFFGVIYAVLNHPISVDKLTVLLETSKLVSISNIILSELAILLVALILILRYGNSFDRASFSINIDLILVGLIILFSLFYIIPSSEIENISASVFGRDLSHINLISQIIEIPGVAGLVIAIFVTSLLPATIEEFFFRGLIQNHLTKKYGQIKSILITSFFFAIGHLNLTGFLSLFILSTLLGYVYVKTNNILYPMILHFMSNFSLIILGGYHWITVKGFNTNPQIIEHTDLILVMPFLILTIGTVFLIYKYKPKEREYLTAPAEK